MQKGDLQFLSKAILFATIKHRDQRRKNSTNAPYIEHPLGVMDILIQVGITDVDVLCAAVLHDTVEDTLTTFEEIGERFGEKILFYVKEVTDDKELDKVTRKKLQIEHAKDASCGARLIKLADKIHNLRSMLTDPPKGWNLMTIRGYFTWSREVTNAASFRTTDKDFNEAQTRLGKILNGVWGIYKSMITYEGKEYPVIPFHLGREENDEFLKLYYKEISEKK